MRYDQHDPEGPPAWWTARCRHAAARQPLCDEYGTPAEDDDADDSDDDDADDVDDGGEE